MQAIEWVVATYPATAGGASDKDVKTRVATTKPRLEALIRLLRYGTNKVPGWPIGTAQIVDVLREMALLARSTADLGAQLDLALADLVVPQMKDLSASQARSHRGRLQGRWPLPRHASQRCRARTTA